MSSKHKQTGRRYFLKQMIRLGAGGAFLATTCEAFGLEARADRVSSPEKQKSQGYRVTPHVQTYYEKAAI